MTKIKNLVNQIDEELEGAKCYAESYVEHKAKGNMNYANKYKEMAMQELSHAMFIHEITVKEIEELEKSIVAPAEMKDKWNKDHAEYVEKSAWVKQMLTL